MNDTVQAAVLMMAAALPTMFIVIAIFICLTNALVAAFPPGDDEE